jgi:UDP-2,4-diacetamido-2,4,6-trideoxy-beta-L-altropyranose hydrolase
MNIVIRTDASIEIGSGHFMRCLTLADQLRSKGAAVSFISRELPGNLCDMAEKKGYGIHRLPFAGQCPAEADATQPHSHWLGVTWETDANETQEILQQLSPPAEWLIVDHYALDKRWETQMRPFTNKIMVIDDIADRPHDCDVLLDQNLYRDMDTRYDGLVPTHCKKLLGPAFALLRPEFIEARKSLRKRDGSVRRILIFFGGSDPTNETTKAIEAISILNRPDIEVDVVVGNVNPHKEQIRQRCSLMPNVIFHGQVENMAELMSQADLAIGAGGTTTWERCCLGLSSITIILAQNQLETTGAVARAGATWDLGRREQVNATLLADTIKRALDNPQELKRMSAFALEIMGDALAPSANVLLNMIIKEQYAAS